MVSFRQPGALALAAAAALLAACATGAAPVPRSVESEVCDTVHDTVLKLTHYRLAGRIKPGLK